MSVLLKQRALHLIGHVVGPFATLTCEPSHRLNPAARFDELPGAMWTVNDEGDMQ